MLKSSGYFLYHIFRIFSVIWLKHTNLTRNLWPNSNMQRGVKKVFFTCTLSPCPSRPTESRPEQISPKKKLFFGGREATTGNTSALRRLKKCLASHAVVFRGARLSSLLSREGTKYEKKILLAGRRETQRGNWGEWTVHPSLIFDYCWFSVSRHSK